MSQEIIVMGAFSINDVYGQSGKMLWHIPEDFKHFREKTTEWTVIMGKLTFESLPPKFQPLPNRENIVVTRTPGYDAKSARVVSSFSQAIAAARTDKVFCIGGASVWYPAMDIADKVWITIVKKEYPVTEGSTHCAPGFRNPSSRWPSFVFNEMTVNKDAEGDVPGFSIVHWVRKK